MRKTLPLACLALLLSGSKPDWGFFAHRQINGMAVFTLPADMIGFYKKNLQYLREAAVNPDRRRYAVPDEAACHYFDLDHYGDSLLPLPKYWPDAERVFGRDSLLAHGILPWHIYAMYHRLRDAFLARDPSRILKLSADLGHYVADAHVPLHTTVNYNGQRTGQEGIHGFWESRLPELFAGDYDFLVGKAAYLRDVQAAAWKIVMESHALVGQVLQEEKKLARIFDERKYAFETRGNITVRVYAREYAAAYHAALGGMVEKRMRAAVAMTGSIWFSAWVDAGQPDLNEFIDRVPSDDMLDEQRRDAEAFKKREWPARPHEEKEMP